MIEFNSQICTTKEQSERLLALGLKVETADMYVTNMSSKGINYTDDWKIGSISYCNAMTAWKSMGLQLEKTTWSIVPAWTLHRLIEMMPCNLSDNSEIDFSKFGVFYAIFHNGQYCLTHAFAKKEKVLYDNIIDCIEWLIKEGYFIKDYLEE